MSKGAEGDTIFCDDIRIEVASKLSLIGVYSGKLIAHGNFPFTLAKFGLLITYSEPIDAYSGDIDIHIYLPGDAEIGEPAFKKTIPRSEILKIPRPSSDTIEKEDVKLTVRMPLVMSPIVLREEGLIKVRAVCDGETIKLGTLRIEKAPVIQKIEALESEK